MDLRRLRSFVAAAEELSFNRAAQRLRIAQPPLSNQIKQLEEELGVRLFERTSRGVRMTEAGEALLEEARRIFVQVDQTVNLVRRVGYGAVGRLTLGFVPSASNEVLPPILHSFRDRYPDVELFLREMRPDRVVQRLHDKQIDVGFLYLPLDDASLNIECVSREPLVLALAESHPLASKARVELQALAEEPFILPARYPMPGLYGQVTEVCRQAGFVPKAVQKDVWLMQTIVGLVAGGIGVALVPASLRNLHRRGVVYKSVYGLSPTVELGVVWRRDDPGVVLNSFLQAVRERFQDQDPVGGSREQLRSLEPSERSQASA
jgi:DNA-binding transcriptional LysR family regulator